MKTNEQPLMPHTDTYEQELLYMPWKRMTKEVAETVCRMARHKSNILDLMCGTGYLLGQIKLCRPDLNLWGVDLNNDFVKYAKSKYSGRKGIEFVQGDVLNMKPFHCEGDLAVLCTGGLHHLPYENQPDLLGVISHLLEERTGFVIIADPCIDDYSTEKERQIAAAKLGYEYLIATLENGGPAEVIKATADLISN